MVYQNVFLKEIKRKKNYISRRCLQIFYGATFKKKIRNFWFNIMNFSFYYAHHMSTIEGGMICTNNQKIYQDGKNPSRSHGMAREAKRIKNLKIR